MIYPRQQSADSGRLHLWVLMAVLALATPALAPQVLAQTGKAPANATALEIADKRVQLDLLEREKAQMERRLARFEQSERELLDEVDRLTGQVRRAHQAVRDLEQQRSTLKAQQTAQSRDIRNLHEQIREGRERIRGRLRRLYRFAKNADELPLFDLAKSRSFTKDAELLARLREADQAAIRDFEVRNADLRQRQREVAATLKDLTAVAEELAGEREKLAEREVFLQEALADMRNNQHLYREYLSSLGDTVEAMEVTLVALEAAPPPPEPIAMPADPATVKGKLERPVAGTLIAGFGEQDPRYNLKKFQRGLVVRVEERAPVTAVLAGRVEFAGPFRGFEELTVLDHGHGLFSVYGHLGELKVQKGDLVRQGAPLGEAAYQPVNQAYDVYFEIRRNGKPEDPQTWLAPGSYRKATKG